MFPRGEPAKGDPALCAQDLERLISLIESPDCHKLSEPPPEWRGHLDQQLTKLRQSLVAYNLRLKSQTPAPWSTSRLLFNGSSPLLQPRMAGNSVWGLEFGAGEKSAQQLRLVRVPLDGSHPRRYDRIPSDGPPDKCYAAIVRDGIVIFPPEASAVSRLTETNGLPSGHASAVACCDGKLYAGLGENSGYEGTAGYLIACELATGRIALLASSMRKEKLSTLDGVSPPFFVRQMVADPTHHRVLFTVDIGIFQHGTPYTGLWSVDTKDDKLTLLLPLTGICEWMSQIRGHEILFARRVRKIGAVYAVLSFNLETNKAKLLYASCWSDADQALIGNGRVCKIPWDTYPPHLVLDDQLWVAHPFCRIPADGGPPEFLPSFVEGHPFGYGKVKYLEPLENSRQILAGVGNQLWLLDLKPSSPAAADNASKVSP